MISLFSPSQKVDRQFLVATLMLLSLGVLSFLSASFGLLFNDGPRFASVAWSHLGLGAMGGLLAMWFLSLINYKIWRKTAIYFFCVALILNFLVAIPGIGVEYGGARRWLELFGQSFQPAELMKIAFVLYFSAWLATNRDVLKRIKTGALPAALIVFLPAVAFVMQKDTDTLIVLLGCATAMYVVAGGRLRDVMAGLLVVAIGLSFIVYTRPYIKERITTFLDPGRDPKGAGYQIQQSLIAIGSGNLTGRGFGQSIQKYKYLPEPMGDSIYSVLSEEFGFVGSSLVILLFLFYCLRGYKIGSLSPDNYGQFIVVGVITVIVVQAYINIAAMLGVIPLSGIPLPFVSQGGTAIFFALSMTGIVFNVSRKAIFNRTHLEF